MGARGKQMVSGGCQPMSLTENHFGCPAARKISTRIRQACRGGRKVHLLIVETMSSAEGIADSWRLPVTSPKLDAGIRAA